MKRLLVVMLMIGASGALPLPVAATGFDVSEMMLCAVLETRECSIQTRECISGGAEMINLPNFFRIDISNKTISSQKGDTQRVTPIDGMQNLGDNLILRGVQNKKAWQVSISGQTGRMTLNAATPEKSFVVFGACTNP